MKKALLWEWLSDIEENIDLYEILREVRENERERIEDERQSVMWFGSYQDAIGYFVGGVRC